MSTIPPEPPEPPDPPKKKTTIIKKKVADPANSKPQEKDEITDLPPVKRLDKVVSGFENQYFSYLVVKKKLTTFTKTVNKVTIIPLIQESVKTMNHITYLSYLFLNFHFLRLLQNSHSNLPKKIDQTMIYRVFAAVSSRNGKMIEPKGDPIWKESVIEFRKHLNDSKNGKYPFPDRRYSCNLINNATQFMLTAIDNHLSLNFKPRLAKYLKIKHKEDDYSKAHYWADRILNNRTPNPEYPSKFDNDLTSEKLIKEYQVELKIKGETRPNIVENIDIFLPFYSKILSFFKDEKTKLFSLLPLKGELIPSYIKICNKSLHDLIGHQNCNWNDFSKAKRKFWDTYFKVNEVETYKHKFDYEILTNGYDVSILLKKQNRDLPADYDLNWDLQKKCNYIEQKKLHDKTMKEEKQNTKTIEKKSKKSADESTIDYLQSLEWWKPDAVIANDTGRRRLFSGISYYKGKDDPITVQCTREEWNHIVGSKKIREKINRRKDSSDLIKSLNEISFKTSSVTEFVTSLKKIVPKLEELFKFYGDRFYSKINFTKYINKQRAFNKIVKRFKVGKRTLVGFGDGNVNSNSCCKGQKLPVNQLYDRVNREKDLRAVRINERNTTKICSVCHHETKGYVKYWKIIEKVDGSSKLVKVTIFGLRRCTNNGCRITWDRDHNARINIYEILSFLIEYKVRPDYLLDKKKTKSLVKKPNPVIRKLAT